MRKTPVKNPLKNALGVKGKQNIKKSSLAKSTKIPNKVSVKDKLPRHTTKIRKA